MSRWTYVAELIQTDPEDSPTPGSGHIAGEIIGRPLWLVRLRARRLIGKPVPPRYFWPCCDWQKPGTLITSVNITRQDPDGNVDQKWGDL